MSGFIFSSAVNADQELENEDFSLKSISVEESSDSRFILQEIWI